MCPYCKYSPGSTWCNFFKNFQDDSTKHNYCLSSDNWKRCPNYTNRTLEEKIKDQVERNPEL